MRASDIDRLAVKASQADLFVDALFRMARQSGWEPRVNLDEKRRPGGSMIVSDGCHLQDLIDARGWA
jgi:hypothetical protein